MVEKYCLHQVYCHDLKKYSNTFCQYLGTVEKSQKRCSLTKEQNTVTWVTVFCQIMAIYLVYFPGDVYIENYHLQITYFLYFLIALASNLWCFKC